MSRLVRVDAWLQKHFDRAAHALMRHGVSKRRLRLGANAFVVVGLLVQNVVLIADGRRTEAFWYCPLIAGLSWIALMEEEEDAKAERAGTVSRVDAYAESGYRLVSRLLLTALFGVDLLISAIAFPRLDIAALDRLRWLSTDVAMLGYWVLAYLQRTRPVPPKQRERVFVVQPEGV